MGSADCSSSACNDENEIVVAQLTHVDKKDKNSFAVQRARLEIGGRGRMYVRIISRTERAGSESRDSCLSAIIRDLSGRMGTSPFCATRTAADSWTNSLRRISVGVAALEVITAVGCSSDND